MDKRDVKIGDMIQSIVGEYTARVVLVMRAEQTILVEVVGKEKGDKSRFKLLQYPELWEFKNKQE